MTFSKSTHKKSLKEKILCSFPVVDALEAMLDAVKELVTEEQNDEGGVR